jgi:hypothetical protein
MSKVPTPIHLFQIAYSAQTLTNLEPGYSLIDNLANERPDWFEYWPIRRYLLTALREGTLEENSFYGFFSPRFGLKTSLTYKDVVELVQSAIPEVDVVLFSPQPDMAAFFLNVYEQGETFDPGLINAFEQFMAQIGRPLNLSELVMNSQHIVFSNYFVARPAFWLSWLNLNEQLFEVCEGPKTTLQKLLTLPTSYPMSAQRKVFIMERTASLLLKIEPHWRSLAANPFTMGWSMSRLRQYPHEAAISDALKLAYCENGFPEYLQAFASVRDHFMAGNPKLA